MKTLPMIREIYIASLTTWSKRLLIMIITLHKLNLKDFTSPLVSSSDTVNIIGNTRLLYSIRQTQVESVKPQEWLAGARHTLLLFTVISWSRRGPAGGGHVGGNSSPSPLGDGQFSLHHSTPGNSFSLLLSHGLHGYRPSRGHLGRHRVVIWPDWSCTVYLLPAVRGGGEEKRHIRVFSQWRGNGIIKRVK